MQIQGKDVVDFLRGENSVRDGRLVGLSLGQGDREWDVVLRLTFDVPTGKEGDRYELTLWGNLSFSYEFSSERALEEIAFVKCLWTSESKFYLSLDPWKEGERFVSEQDSDCFSSDRVTLVVGKRDRQEPSRNTQDRLEVWHDGSAICVIAVGSHGDPLDLGEGEVEDLIDKLRAALVIDGA